MRKATADESTDDIVAQLPFQVIAKTKENGAKEIIAPKRKENIISRVSNDVLIAVSKPIKKRKKAADDFSDEDDNTEKPKFKKVAIDPKPTQKRKKDVDGLSDRESNFEGLKSKNVSPASKPTNQKKVLGDYSDGDENLEKPNTTTFVKAKADADPSTFLHSRRASSQKELMKRLLKKKPKTEKASGVCIRNGL